MILHLSQALAKRLKCSLSYQESKIAQPGRPDAWSADLFRVPRAGAHALVMHDASLWPIIIPLQECPTYHTFLKALLIHIELSYAFVGREFDGADVTVVATKRCNRSIIGSMNNAIYLVTSRVEGAMTAGEEINWSDIQSDLSQTPFMSLEGFFPYKAWARVAHLHESPP